jgi:Xaa-Pro aminopeptidase
LSARNTFPYDAADLHRFRQVQRLAFGIAQQVESQLQAGMTEAEAATLLAAAQAQNDIFQVFHEPYAWFGVRTMLGPEWTPERPSTPNTNAKVEAKTSAIAGATAASTPQFTINVHPAALASARSFPTHEVLTEGMPVVLDLAPVVGGIASDIAYSFTFSTTKPMAPAKAGKPVNPNGTNKLFNELDAGLARIRTFLLEGIRAGESLLDLYRLLDDLLDARGWLNCHQHYPARALGHYVFPLGHDSERTTPIPGFGTAAAEGLLAAGVHALADDACYPVWNDSAVTDYPASPGLWAVEPHIGCDGVGVKFEELLVVTEDDAYWLDDALPHVQRWAAARYSTESFRRG